MIENPDVTSALKLWRACEGKPGIDALRSLSPHAVDAFAVIDAGRAAKLADEAAQARESRAADVDHQQNRRGRRR